MFLLLKCRLKISDGPWCWRTSFVDFALAGLARKMAPDMRIHVVWSKVGFEKQTWIGKVVSKSCDTQAWCKYVGQKGLWSFPPADPALRVHRVSLPAVCQQGLSKTELRKRLRHAGVGSFVDLRFERGGALVKWVGVVAWMGKGVCRVRWLGVKTNKTNSITLWFPPPRTCAAKILFVRFTKPTLSLKGGHASAALRRLRFLNLLQGCSNDVAIDAAASHVTCNASDGVLLGAPVVSETAPAHDAPGQGKKKNTLTIATFNPRSLCDVLKIEALCGYSATRGLGIIICPGTMRSSAAPAPSTGHFQWHESPANDAGQWGIGALLGKAAAALLERFKVVVQHRVILLVFPKVVVIGVYLPTYVNLADRALCFAQIGLAIAEFPRSLPLVVAGDFNSRPKEQCTDSALRMASDQFYDFMLQHSLHAANINFPGKGTEATHQQHKSHRTSTLDYVLVRSRFKSSVRNVVVRNGPFSSDHKVVEATLKTKWKAPLRALRDKRPALETLRQKEVADAFVAVALKVVPSPALSLVMAVLAANKTTAPQAPAPPTPAPTASALDTAPCLALMAHLAGDPAHAPLSHPDFVARVQAALSTLVKVEPPTPCLPHCPFPSALNFISHYQRLLSGSAGCLDLVLHLVTTQCPRGHVIATPTVVGISRGNSWQDPIVKDLLFLQSVTNDIRGDIIVSAIESVNASAIDSLVSMYAKVIKEDPRKAYRFITSAKTSQSTTMPAKDSADRMRKFFVHFSNLYKSAHEPPSLEHRTAEIFEQQLRFNDAPFTWDELTAVLARCKDNKSVGLDEIPNEVLRLFELRTHILHILNEMLRGTVFKEQKETVIVPLPKKGDLSEATNWRGISLMPHLTKIFDSLVYARLLPVIDPHLCPGQNGFRPDRGTSEHVLSLSLLRDLAVTHDFPIHGCFVDFSKAFDSVKWDDISAQLSYWQVPPILHDAVFRIMRGHVVRVRVDGDLSDPINVEVGVLQGDTLAPFLFNLVLDSVLRKLPEECGVLLSVPCPRLTQRQRALGLSFKETRLAFLAFADDVCLFTHSEADLQRLLSTFESLAFKVGLKINMGKGKTERFCIGPAKGASAPAQIRITAGVVPLTDNYRYLGVWALDFDDEMNRKKGRAWASMKAIDGVWHSSVSMSVKRDLFRAIVEPILTYGLCAWPLTAERTKRVDGMFGTMLRYALGLPASFISHDLVGTESLYGNIPFLSSMLASRRIGLIAHTLRAHVEGRTHALMNVLLFEPSDTLQPRRGPRCTVISSVLHQCRIEFREQLVPLMSDRVTSRQLVRDVERRSQEAVYHAIGDRRVLHLLSYFEMPRRVPKPPADDVPIFAALLARRRRPATIWSRPRPTLARGCIRFEKDHYLNPLPKRPKTVLPYSPYLLPMPPQQVWAMKQARIMREVWKDLRGSKALLEVPTVRVRARQVLVTSPERRDEPPTAAAPPAHATPPLPPQHPCTPPRRAARLITKTSSFLEFVRSAQGPSQSPPGHPPTT